MTRTLQQGGATIQVLRQPPPQRLDSLKRVRLELNKLYRDAREGVILTADASRLAFMLLSIGKLIEAEVLEQRVSALESEIERP